MPNNKSIKVIFTRRTFNPMSLLIRWMVPRSRTTLAGSSHSMVVDGDTGHVIEAHMLDGVRRVPIATAIKGAKVVRIAVYEVADAKAGLDWWRSQICQYKPNLPRWMPAWLQAPVGVVLRLIHNNYDFKGAVGIGIAPDRNWQDPINWSCFEGTARTIKEAGSDVFAESGYMTETILLAVKHSTVPAL